MAYAPNAPSPTSSAEARRRWRLPERQVAETVIRDIYNTHNAQ